MHGVGVWPSETRASNSVSDKPTTPKAPSAASFSHSTSIICRAASARPLCRKARIWAKARPISSIMRTM